MNKLLAVFLFVLMLLLLELSPFLAQAQIIPSIPYTLTNGSLADATQVMGNFNTIITDVNANAATSGANTNITSITGLTTALANTYGGTVIYNGGTTGGSANAQTIASTVPSNFALTTGNIVTGVAGATNTTAVTLAVNGGTATQTAVQTPLGLISTPAKSLVTGQGFVAYFDGTYFELLGAPPANIANSQLGLMSADTVKVNATNANATPTDLALASNNLLGVGSAGNIAPITLDTTLTMSTNVLSATTGTTSQLGVLKPDGTTIKVSAGVISQGAPAALGVGSIIIASCSSAKSAGATCAAANLTDYYFSAAAFNDTHSVNLVASGDSLTGTWQALTTQGSDQAANGTLYQRTI